MSAKETVNSENTQYPTNAAEVRSFLGLVNYCNKFILNLATKSVLLSRLLRQMEMDMGIRTVNSVKGVKRLLTSSHVVVYIVDTSPVEL